MPGWTAHYDKNLTTVNVLHMYKITSVNRPGEKRN